jgi:hypothetical protein
VAYFSWYSDVKPRVTAHKDPTPKPTAFKKPQILKNEVNYFLSVLSLLVWQWLLQVSQSE